MTVAELMFEAAYGKGAYDAPADISADDCNEALLLSAFKKLNDREAAEFLASCIAKHLAWRKSNVKATAKNTAFNAAKKNHALLTSLVRDGFHDMAIAMYGRPSFEQEMVKQGKTPPATK